MNDNLTEIVAILDKSGSMEHLTNDTIGGFNGFLKEQKEIPGEAVLTTVLFNDSYMLLHDRVSIKDVKPMSNKEYVAGGSTALLDALGKTINDIGLKLHDAKEEDRPGKVIFFIITDGEENASHEFTNDKVKEMVELQRNTYKWDFIFLGANIDSFSTATSIGIDAGLACDIAEDGEGIRYAQLAMSQAVRNKRVYGSIDAKEAINFRDKLKRPKARQKANISPKWIKSLSENEIFVFGSNLAGFHGGGAAELAMEWGAVWGQGVGLQGKTYAIPTMFEAAQDMKPYIDEFLAFAKAHRDLKFLVTELGCGIANFTPKDVAPFFRAVADEKIDNVWLPERFAAELEEHVC